MFVHITGTGSYLPGRVVTNDELAAKLDTTDEWIYSHTGIRSRHIGAENESASTMAAEAARAALASAGVSAEQIGLIIVASSSSDYHSFPSTACLVQSKIGAYRAAAFDLEAAPRHGHEALEPDEEVRFVGGQVAEARHVDGDDADGAG